ncbi:hypothetical protein [Paenibacillus sp. YAF4_2]|uniref:hypothetical protein n=1 Tax=Paenibacillus sp. YAF4_2 TaxID=3233085 RepID=UPI003F951FA2
MKRIIPIILSVLLLTTIIVYSKTSSANKLIHQKVTFALESEENLSDWKVVLTPYLKTSIKKWVYDLDIQYTGNEHITNIEYSYGTIKGNATLTEPSTSSWGTIENLVPKNGNEISVNIQWDEPQGKNYNGKAIYTIARSKI